MLTLHKNHGRTMNINVGQKVYVFLIISLFTRVFAIAQEGKITMEQDKRIDRLIEIKKELNKVDDGEKRYRIQIYNGTLNEARGIVAGFKANFPDWSYDIRFETPNYKVWVGKYRARLEAERYLAEIKKKYPNAFILIP